MLKNILYKYLFSIVDAIFPPICQCCGKRLTSINGIICKTCEDDIPYTYHWHFLQNELSARINSKESVEGALALFYYEKGSGYDKLIHNLKYHNQRKTALFLGKLLGERILESGTEADYDYIVPIPLHPYRKWWRGYNQSLIIAQGITSVINVPILNDCVIRVKRSRQQAKMKNDKERFNNMANAFALKGGGVLNGQRILLVDDVITSGATIISCINTIKSGTRKCSITAVSLSATQ